MSPITITLLILLTALIENIGANDRYSSAVVSFWRLDDEGKTPETFLSIGALIKPNAILILTQLLFKFEPLNTIGFYTGQSYKELSRMKNSIIIDSHELPSCDAFSIVTVKPSLELQATFVISDQDDFPNEVVLNDHAFFIGWNRENGLKVQLVSFKRKMRIYLSQESREEISQDDFPTSSFLVKGMHMMAITSHICASRGYRFSQVSVKSSGEYRKLLDEINDTQEMADPYPDAIVSFWRQENQRRQFLFLGALIDSNLILVPRIFCGTLEELKTLVLYTGRKYDKILRPIKSTIDGEIPFPGTSEFTILVMKPGIRLPSPYMAIHPSTYVGKPSNGDIIEWNGQNGPQKKAVSWHKFQGIHLEFKDEYTTLENLPLISMLVRNEEFIAFYYNDPRKQPELIELSVVDFKSIKTLLQSRNKRQSSHPKLMEDKDRKKAVN